MKKIISLALALIMIFAAMATFTSCDLLDKITGNNNSSNDENENNESVIPSEERDLTQKLMNLV